MARFFSWPRVRVAFLSVVAACGAGWVALRAMPAFTGDAAVAPAQGEENSYAVPDGTPKEIMSFIESLEQRRIVGSRRERVLHAIAVQKARIEAGDKILAQKTEGEAATDAAQMKLEALTLLASARVEDFRSTALKSVDAMRKDARKDVADLATRAYTALRIITAPDLKETERAALVKSVLDDVKKQGTGTALQTAIELGQALEEMEDSKVPADYYEQLAKAVEHVNNPRFEPLVGMLQAMARRLKLPGNTMKITGTTVDGQPFDWAKYRGKVVLVDFWATWCGPCRAELPNVKANYEKYHGKGFEVVGISGDEDLEALKSFLEEEKIPWVNLFEPSKDGQPVPQPTAEYYAVSAIPTAILVGRDGKVISLQARGEELTRLLEQQFAKAE